MKDLRPLGVCGLIKVRSFPFSYPGMERSFSLDRSSDSCSWCVPLKTVHSVGMGDPCPLRVPFLVSLKVGRPRRFSRGLEVIS